jgi:hypothetical protein
VERANYTGEAAARADLGTPRSKPTWLENQHSLPFQFLSPDEFEIFCYLLLCRENPGENICYYGKTGDAGRDIVRIKDNGSVEVIQCKHYQRNVDKGEIRTEIAKLYVNIHSQIIPKCPDKVIFYVVPDLTAPAHDLINYHSKWIEIAESALKEYLKKEPTPELVDFALSWHPQFSKQTAIDLTQRAWKHKELVYEFFSVKKVVESEVVEQKLNVVIEQTENINEISEQLKAVKQAVEQLSKTGNLSLQPQVTNAPLALQNLLRQAEEYNPEIAFTANSDSQKTVFTLAAKANEVSFGTIVFPDTEAGTQGKHKFQMIIEEGRAIELEPGEYQWRWDIKLPEISLSPMTLKTLSFYPRIPEICTPIRLDILHDRETVASVNFTHLRLVRAGTREMEFLIEGGQLTGKITLVLSLQDENLTLKLSDIDLCSITAVQAQNIISIMFALCQGSKIQVTSLENNSVLLRESEGNVNHFNISEEEFEKTQKLLDCLIKINREFGLDIRFPQIYDDKTVKTAELIVAAIDQGKIEHPSGIFRLFYGQKDALKFLEILREESSFDFSMDTEAEDYQLLDYALPMGKTRLVFENIFPIDGLQALEEAAQSLPESEEMEISLRYDRAIQSFLRWLPEATDAPS